MRDEVSIHATGLLIGEIGLLVTGASGAGKSRFVPDVAARLAHLPIRLIADDRIRLARVGRRLVARPVAGFLGKIELRGLGIARHPAMPSAVVRGIVALAKEPIERLPDQPFETQELLGVYLPVLPLESGADASAAFITKWPYFRGFIMGS
jgi:serine kinase of HPr protein (carbohydrate metabolism regulator)